MIAQCRAIHPSMLIVNPNIHFTKLVKIASRLREFNFRLLPGTSKSLLHVDVPDDRGNRIVFKMQRQDNQSWKIIEDGLPIWISGSEPLLNEAIAEDVN
jgi:hypothetical protein